jgi:hypothetical protein
MQRYHEDANYFASVKDRMKSLLFEDSGFVLGRSIRPDRKGDEKYWNLSRWHDEAELEDVSNRINSILATRGDVDDFAIEASISSILDGHSTRLHKRAMICGRAYKMAADYHKHAKKMTVSECVHKKLPKWILPYVDCAPDSPL